MARFKSINDIVNQVAVETGFSKQPDVFTSNDAAFTQLTTLANSVGKELIQDGTWNGLTRTSQIVTQAGDDGKYPLPDDFEYMVDQTGWDNTNNVPVGGSLTPQQWTYLEGRDLVSFTIYASFRQTENELWLYPQPPPVGLDITFEYVSSNWVQPSGVPDTYADQVMSPADIVLFNPYMFERLLKLRFLEARGLDTTAAMTVYERSLQSQDGKDTSSQILNMSNRASGVPLLDTFRNTPDTNYGS